MKSSTGDTPASSGEARRVFHDTGDIPARLLAEPLRRSWRRSAGTGVNTRQPLEFDPVTRGRLQELQDRNEPLLTASAGVVDELLRTVVRTPWLVLLLGADGVIAEALNDSSRLSRELRSIARPGLDLSEPRIGTNGPGTALVEGRPVLVVGQEHYLESNAVYTCAAAPIRDPYGRLAGCLDLSSHCTGGERRFNPLALVSSSARIIEDRMFGMLPAGHRVVRLASHRGLFGPCGEALVALDGDGRVVAANAVALTLFGLPLAQLQGLEAGQLFDLPSFRHLAGQREAATTGSLLTLANGLTMLARLEWTAALPSAGLAPGPSDAAGEAARTFDVGDAVCAAAIGRARRAYAHGIAVLLRGETGTGKELLARALHEGGPRRKGPWVAINCAAIPENLIESELFGYVDGAFTGARRGGAPGKLEQAHGGTLFLDEIGDMPLALQTRLLRVLEERKVTRVGGQSTVAVDFALISATHQDLARMVREGTFRLDLYYRLNGLAVHLPPLRERAGFAEIVERILDEVAPGARPVTLSDGAWALLAGYAWPGNLRELASVLRTAAVFADAGEILPGHLPDHLAQAAQAPPPDDSPLAGSLDEVEWAAIRHAITAQNGNMSAAARALGISRGTLYRKLKAFAGSA